MIELKKSLKGKWTHYETDDFEKKKCISKIIQLIFLFKKHI